MKRNFLKAAVVAMVFAVTALAGVDASAAGERLMAHTFAKTVVRGHMKAPATSNVCPWGDLVEYRISDMYRGDELVEASMVTGWIDSQNSFGALIRSEWRVVFVDEKVVSYTVEGRNFVVDGQYVRGKENTPAEITARGLIREREHDARMERLRLSPVVEDARSLAAIHAKALGKRRATLTKREAEARAKTHAAVAMRRVKTKGADISGADIKSKWMEAYVDAILKD